MSAREAEPLDRNKLRALNIQAEEIETVHAQHCKVITQRPTLHAHHRRAQHRAVGDIGEAAHGLALENVGESPSKFVKLTWLGLRLELVLVLVLVLVSRVRVRVSD